MNKINIYLSSFVPDNMKFLVEFLNYEYGYLKTHYYEVSFELGEEKSNTIKITGIKELDEVLPYFESVFKKGSIKDRKLDEETTNDVIKLLCKELLDKNENKITLEKEVKINLDKQDNTSFEEIENPNISNDSFNSYLFSKRSFNNYLKSKREFK